jgi:hypothetical protein
MSAKNKALIPVLAPFLLGLAVALLFLVHYLHKNKALVTVRNSTGRVLMNSQLSLTSLPKEQEVGEIPAGDSAQVLFEGFGAGHLVFTGQFRGGAALRDSGAELASGASYRVEVALEERADSVTVRFSQSPLT